MGHEPVSLLGKTAPVRVEVHLGTEFLGDLARAVLAAAVDHHHLVGERRALDAACDSVGFVEREDADAQRRLAMFSHGPSSR